MRSVAKKLAATGVLGIGLTAAAVGLAGTASADFYGPRCYGPPFAPCGPGGVVTVGVGGFYGGPPPFIAPPPFVPGPGVVFVNGPGPCPPPPPCGCGW